MRIAIFGSGAVGTYFGGRLAEAGAHVIFVARGANLVALKHNGLRIKSPAGDYEVAKVLATDNPAEVEPVDAVLLCTKAWAVADAAETLRPLIGKDTFVVPLQNGVDSPRVLCTRIAPEKVIGGLCFVFADLTAPGEVTHTGSEPRITFGEWDNSRSERVLALEAVFKKCRGVSVQVPESIQHAIWEKFLGITSISGLGALTRMPVGVLRSMPELRALMISCMREVQALARAHGVNVSDQALEKMLQQRDRVPFDSTTSMQRDIIAGRRSELEWQTGAIVRLAEEKGVEAPVNRFIYNCLLPLELAAQGVLPRA